MKGLPALRGLANVWFDTPVICEAAPLVALLREFGPQRIMWGSDLPFSQLRGKCVTMGDGFIFLRGDTVLWDQLKPPCHPILAGLEALRALQEAADYFGLNGQDVEDIFYNNALRLLDICQPAP